MPGTLFVVATPIGNLEDITGRALRILRDASVIAAEDTRRTARLLAHYAITTPTTSLHEHNEKQKSPALVARLSRGDNIALVSDAGTPTLSDPGQRLVSAAVEAGVRVEPIPGASAVMAALSVSGLPNKRFSFLGFPPNRSSDRKEWFEQLRQESGSVVFFEAPHRVVQTLAELQRTIGDCAVLLARELTKVHETLVRGPISTVLHHLDIEKPRGEFTIVIDVGQSTLTELAETPSDADIYRLFGDITKTAGASRKRAINLVAKRFALPSNAVYGAIERAKKSAK